MVAWRDIPTGDAVVKYTFFGFQIAIRTTVDSRLRAELADLIVSSRERQTVLDKHAFWTRLCTLLRRHKNDFFFGDWDFVRGDKAADAFEHWTMDIETSSAQPSALQLLPGEARPEWRGLHHALVTGVFLVERHTNSDRTLGEACDLEELNFFTRDTFFLFLGAVAELNFASVRSDAIYVVPGPGTEGFSMEVLMSHQFKYLQQLS
jgi:hypothetical protein